MSSGTWPMLAALWIIIVFNFGFTTYAPAIINPVMIETLGLNHQTLGNLFALYMLTSGLPGPFVALSINRWGTFSTLALGSTLIVCGALLMATVVSGTTGALLCFGILVGAGSITGSLLPSQTALARRFVRRRATFLAILYSGGAIGGSIAAPLVDRLIRATGTWRSGWWTIAGCSAIAGCMALMLRRTDARHVTAGGAPYAEESRPLREWAPPFVSYRNWTYRQAVRHPTYWLMLSSFLGASGGNTVVLAHGVAHLRELGHSAHFAALAVSTMTVSNLVGKGLLATVGGNLDPRLLLAGFLASYGAGLTLICSAHTEWQTLLSMACLGVGFGGGFVSLMTVVSNYYGTAAFPALAGTMTAIPTAWSAVVSSIAGELFDVGTGYATTFYVLGIVCFIGSATVAVVRPPTLEDAV